MEKCTVEEAKGLSLRLNEYIPSLLGKAYHSLLRKANRRLEEMNSPVNIEQLPVLMIVFISTSPLPQKDIASVCQRDKSSVNRTIKSFLQANLIKIVDDEVDRRVKKVQLTDYGRSFCEELCRFQDVIETELKTYLGKDNYQALATLLQSCIVYFEKSEQK